MPSTSPLRARKIRLHAPTFATHSSGTSDNAASRARASSPCFMSCVDVASIVRGHRSARCDSLYETWTQKTQIAPARFPLRSTRQSGCIGKAPYPPDPSPSPVRSIVALSSRSESRPVCKSRWNSRRQASRSTVSPETQTHSCPLPLHTSGLCHRPVNVPFILFLWPHRPHKCDTPENRR